MKTPQQILVKEVQLDKAFKAHTDFNLEEDFRYPYHLTPYQGCSFGCVYCFNTKTDKYWNQIDGADKQSEGRDRIKQIAVATNIASLVREELPTITTSGALPLWVRIGTEAEIYGPAEERYRVMSGVLEQFIGYPGWKGEIPTKSSLVLRDLHLLKQLDFHVTMTIVTTDEGLASRLEPYAPSVAERIDTLRHLRSEGVRCRIRCEPYLEGISDLDNLERIKEELGIEKLKVKKLNYYTLDEIKKMIL